MMPTFRYSKNYWWSTDDILGKGATSVVYRGIHRSTGEQVAIKTFTHNVAIREFEVLKKINHENIVKLLAIEEEDTARVGRDGSKPYIIVTELCSGGCLDTIIQKPQHVRGLTDSEFLVVLKDLYQGMMYLREKDLVHRDLKPGNIMKFLKDDGSVVYKLIDFGAARELSDEAEFKSLYGTEEYLAPDMYKRAMLPYGGESITFQATVDLWSIGVTLYHVATGRLPFIPFGGRQNRDKHIMHYITSTKAPGVISGVQKEFNGPIHWSKELPEDCLLSTGLRKLVTPLLAGLLESNNNKIWTFDKFFHHVGLILSKRLVHVFCVNSPNLLQVYLNPKGNLNQLQQEISIQTDLKLEQKAMTFVYKAALLKGSDSIPKTTEENPLFLINLDDLRVCCSELTKLHRQIDFTRPVKTYEDIKQAKNACCIAHNANRTIKKFLIHSKLMCDLVKEISSYIKQTFSRLDRQNQHCLRIIRTLRITAEIFETSQKVSDPDQTNVHTSADLRKISDDFYPVSQTISALCRKYCCEEFAEGHWQAITKGLKKPHENRHNTRSSLLVEQLETAWENLKLFNRNPESTEYLIQKRKSRQTLSRLVDLLELDIHPHYKALCQFFEDWYKILQADLLKVDILANGIRDVETRIDKFEEELNTGNKQITASVEKRRLAVQSKPLKINNKLGRDLSRYTSRSSDILDENMRISAVWNEFLVDNESFLLESTESLNKLKLSDD